MKQHFYNSFQSPCAMWSRARGCSLLMNQIYFAECVEALHGNFSVKTL